MKVVSRQPFPLGNSVVCVFIHVRVQVVSNEGGLLSGIYAVCLCLCVFFCVHVCVCVCVCVCVFMHVRVFL